MSTQKSKSTKNSPPNKCVLCGDELDPNGKPCSLKDCNKRKATPETKRRKQQQKQQPPAPQKQTKKTKKPKGNGCLGDGCLGGFLEIIWFFVTLPFKVVIWVLHLFDD